VAATVDRFGGLHVMYNNAGISGTPRRFLKDTLADFDDVVGVSLRGAMLGSQAAARQMVTQGGGGVIVNTASLAGITPGAGVMSYRVAKAGVIHFTRCLALELAEHGIRVNAVAPANIPTAMNAPFDMTRTIEMTQPLQRQGSPGDAAQAVLYLASDRAAQVTGMVLPVDGGTSVGIPVQRMAEIMAPRAPTAAATPATPAAPPAT
jgi:NAD(P)-dependent dehydrogenase (short-subunit alcohol dehydrogenase family)